MNIHTLHALALTAALTITLGCAMTKDGVPPPETVSHVDLDRYLGTWYEIARYPNSFQEGCVGSRATYSFTGDGRISVLNECNEGSPDGRLRQALGRARVVDETTNAKLKVSFFWPFEGDYWIIELGDDYEYAVIGHPERKYLWILCREKSMDESVYNGILERLRTVHHYDTSRLIRTRRD